LIGGISLADDGRHVKHFRAHRKLRRFTSWQAPAPPVAVAGIRRPRADTFPMQIVLLFLMLAGCQRPAQPGSTALSAEESRWRIAVRADIHTDQLETRKLRVRLTSTNYRAAMGAAVANYLAIVEALDLSRCPDEFAEAYRHYLASWQRFADVLADPRADAKGEEIDKRWGEVLEAARRYGAVK
jgi:hypothetical protein